MLARTAVMTFCCLVATIALYGFAAPGPKVTAIAGPFAWAPDSTIAYRARVVLSGPLGLRDSVRYTQYRDGILVAAPRTKNLDTTFTWAAPGYDSTVKVAIFARVFRGTNPSGGFKGDSASYTRGPAPEIPAPVVDTVVLSPPGPVSLGPGGSVQFTAVVFSR
jgi:hypothetical protein